MGKGPNPRHRLRPRGTIVPLYIRLVRLTENAKRNVNRISDMLAEARRITEANGVKIVEGYSTLGR